MAERTGVSIDTLQLRSYCEPGQQGPGTEHERRALLEAHRAKVDAQIETDERPFG